MLLSYCRLLVEMGRDKEAYALCVEGLWLAGGLEVVLCDGDGYPSGDFVDARTHEAIQQLLAELKAAQERGGDTVRVLEASGRAVCDAHFTSGGKKSSGTNKAVVLIKKAGGTQLTVLLGQNAMRTVPADWVLGGGWREDALVFDADGASAGGGGGGALGAGHPVVLHLKALLPSTGITMDAAGKDALYLELIAAWQRCGALETVHRFVALLPSPRPLLDFPAVDAFSRYCVLPHKANALLDVCMCVRMPLVLVRMDGEESALEVLRVTSERAKELLSWGGQLNVPAKTAEAKALYEDLLPRMEHELVR
eukprot:COSAG06_NODE_394_length_16313_cov_11.756568_2_plen_309_part_00